MKFRPRLGTLAVVLFLWAALGHSAIGVVSGQRLGVIIEPRFNGKELTFDSPTNLTRAGQRVSVTRLDFLLSNVALLGADRSWRGQTNGFAFLSPREGRSRFEVANVSPGRYTALRFQVGVPPELNHADPAGFEPTHPLNPNLNGLHWSWQRGYVFLAIEGEWVDPDDSTSGRGYSFHVANDGQLMTVELPLNLDLSTDVELRLAFNLERIFDWPGGEPITPATSSTHSRAGDPLAVQLSRQIERAFSVMDLEMPARTLRARSVDSRSVVLASNATPYRLTFPRSFPLPELPADNPITEEGVELGRRLFHDKRLSINGRQACASCHVADQGFVDPGQRFSLGAEGQVGTRNAMPLFNLAWKREFFWDGRAPSLRQQVLMPIENPIEMHESLARVERKLDTLEDRERFARAFGSKEISRDRIARALEQFLLVQVSHNSRFDRSLRGEVVLTHEEQRGLELFHTEYDPRRGQFGADCFHCHGGPLFQNVAYANNGLDRSPADPGRFLVTSREGDKGKFAVPSLRNVARTAPYMHDGRFSTLEEVVEHYSTGVRRSPTLDPNLAKHPDGGVFLSKEDQQALVAFLKTLGDVPPTIDSGGKSGGASSEPRQ